MAENTCVSLRVWSTYALSQNLARDLALRILQKAQFPSYNPSQWWVGHSLLSVPCEVLVLFRVSIDRYVVWLDMSRQKMIEISEERHCELSPFLLHRHTDTHAHTHPLTSGLKKKKRNLPHVHTIITYTYTHEKSGTCVPLSIQVQGLFACLRDDTLVRKFRESFFTYSYGWSPFWGCVTHIRGPLYEW